MLPCDLEQVTCPLHLDVFICKMGGKQSSFEGAGFTAVMQEMITEL